MKRRPGRDGHLRSGTTAYLAYGTAFIVLLSLYVSANTRLVYIYGLDKVTISITK